MEDWEHGGFGIYLHWPFCEAKCPYCDFNSYVARSIDHNRWTKAYLAELRRYRVETGPRTLTSVFLGGGTPSLMQPSSVGQILDEIQKLWPTANDLEVTLEANPSSVEAQLFADFRQAGVNRVSLGVQALDNHDLKRLGRLHSVDEAVSALDIARSHFERVSFDLIYARQDQTLDAWQTELTRALDFAPDHLSLYQLTIEDGTAFGDRYRANRLPGLPSEDLSADLCEITQELCEAAGLSAYEVSNHAKDGAASRHNLIYWRGGDYVGIGPGAHGRLTLDGVRQATETHLQPAAWLEAAETSTGETLRKPLDPTAQWQELLLMGLRLSGGVSIVRLEALGFHNGNKINYLKEIGVVDVVDGHLQATRAGRPILNSVVAELY